MDQSLLTRYAVELKALKEKTTEVKALGDEVLAALQAENMEKMQMPEGTFSVVMKKKYEYEGPVVKVNDDTDLQVNALKDKLEAELEAAIAAGTVKVIETPTLRFQATK